MIMDKKERILPHTKNLQRCFGKWQTYTLNWGDEPLLKEDMSITPLEMLFSM